MSGNDIVTNITPVQIVRKPLSMGSYWVHRCQRYGVNPSDVMVGELIERGSYKRIRVLDDLWEFNKFDILPLITSKEDLIKRFG